MEEINLDQIDEIIHLIAPPYLIVKEWSDQQKHYVAKYNAFIWGLLIGSEIKKEMLVKLIKKINETEKPQG